MIGDGSRPIDWPQNETQWVTSFENLTQSFTSINRVFFKKNQELADTRGTRIDCAASPNMDPIRHLIIEAN